jgi:Mlc titration factor MtfA (ptsG expression regulator)
MRIVRPSSLWTAALLAIVVGGAVAFIGAQATGGGAWLGLPVVLVAAWASLRGPLRRWRLARQPFPHAWARWLRRRVPLYRALDADARTRFEHDVRFAMDELSFEGVGGVEVTDELRLGVAAGVACLLHGRPDWELPGTRSVLFYPDRFDDDYFGGDFADYDGMAHEQGPVILAAPAVTSAWSRADGQNVVLHELAHLFDFDDAGPDGVPSLVAPASVESWRALVEEEMRRVEAGRSILRPYAATAPSEFFATAVEVFFERPRDLARRHGALYDALSAFFNLDPRSGRKEEVDRAAT